MIKASFPNSFGGMSPVYAANGQTSCNQIAFTSSHLASLSTTVSGTSIEAWLEQLTPPLSSSDLRHNSLKRKLRRHSWPLLSSPPRQNSPRGSPYNMTEPEHSDPRVSRLYLEIVQIPSLIADCVLV